MPGKAIISKATGIAPFAHWPADCLFRTDGFARSGVAEGLLSLGVAQDVVATQGSARLTPGRGFDLANRTLIYENQSVSLTGRIRPQRVVGYDQRGDRSRFNLDAASDATSQNMRAIASWQRRFGQGSPSHGPYAHNSSFRDLACSHAQTAPVPHHTAARAEGSAQSLALFTTGGTDGTQRHYDVEARSKLCHEISFEITAFEPRTNGTFRPKARGGLIDP